MVDRILQTAQESTYDFRKTACAHDPLNHRFEEWVPYYRLKWAIAKVLGPRRILEVGVRFGYSAMAFLDACPDAEYVGIDADLDTYGGCKGAIEWARESTRGYRAEFVVGDSQAMSTFPGGEYNLIHIDGQQDGDGTVHDFELAIRQAEWVFADGCFHSRNVAQNIMECLRSEKPLTSYSLLIPDNEGALLVRTQRWRKGLPSTISSSADLRNEYTRTYYMCDCGGFEQFSRNRAQKLEDPRLRLVAAIADLAPRGTALDLGCGRGELAIELGRRGFDVTAIDYSNSAIQLAREALGAQPACSSNCHFLCADLNTVPLPERCELATAADLVEHMSPMELDEMYRRVSRALSSDGLLVIHTYPNSWSLRYGHVRKLRLARSVGAYLPTNPRSWYERSMHINEQSPRSLRKQLRRHFPHVFVWLVGHDCSHPADHLMREFSLSEMRDTEDIMAIASHSPLDVMRIAGILRMMALPERIEGSIRIAARANFHSQTRGRRFPVQVRIANGTESALNSWLPHPVNLSYHWVDEESQKASVFDGLRTALWPALASNAIADYEMEVEAPPRNGPHRLRVTLVQEGVRWFDTPPTNTFAEISMVIS